MKSDSECILKSTLWNMGLADELGVKDNGKKEIQTSVLSSQIVNALWVDAVKEDLGIWQNPMKENKLIQDRRG